ncbi:MAG: cytochrome c biogenesis heme-transporting ATPase CcmA [Duodenibacillus sp.]|nr:cytochrome c biogenesis heme-transporting ATPase CcmA [Duodenibacillus sp.]
MKWSGARVAPDGLAVRGLECTRGDRLLFTGLSFEAPPGTLLRLAGPNGAGKTTLLRLLAGLQQPDAGEVLWRCRPIGKMREDFHADLLYIGHLNGVKDDLSAFENVRIASRLGSFEAYPDEIERALGLVGLQDFVHHTTGELSQGQRRRVALARLFVSIAKPLWILDEPFTALDAASVANLAHAIGTQVEAGGIVVYTTHQECPIDVPDYARKTLDVSAYAPAGEDPAPGEDGEDGEGGRA